MLDSLGSLVADCEFLPLCSENDLPCKARNLYNAAEYRDVSLRRILIMNAQ